MAILIIKRELLQYLSTFPSVPYNSVKDRVNQEHLSSSPYIVCLILLVDVFSLKSTLC